MSNTLAIANNYNNNNDNNNNCVCVLKTARKKCELL